MSQETLLASVGFQATNRAADVALVQRLLLRRGYRVGLVDGICGDRTRAAIRTFQQGFLSVPDGRVDPGGTTWRHLQEKRPAPTRDGGSLTRLVALPPRNSVNNGLVAANNAYMVQKLGQPRSQYGVDCQPVTDPRLKRNIRTEMVGPLRVTGLVPALQNLRTVVEEIRTLQPDIHAGLGTAGMLCCRYVRGSTTAISNHSWGTAIDVKINGELDDYRDGLVQYGLTLIAPIFNRHGWYWGVTFSREDGMHFEASRSLIDSWSQQIV
ncbi:hypothetical protein ABIC99_002739 [Sphaerotilus sulfidivorans]|uniref:Peptidoglycan-binding protein n=1 Tax=Sphaerotilus sulfidivorans TaxID=639200 RepID=A0A5C1PX99_9BURK|nr:M15 family metallopeptidase [Sphaerotilus sulfidivorans]NZD47901.1 M15 family metallopeptidase [Sphaerotilus sulfidivorans]QEN00027.1 peptidoglycan-binding protein [Sphaerotilus sulfidivorans]